MRSKNLARGFKWAGGIYEKGKGLNELEETEGRERLVVRGLGEVLERVESVDLGGGCGAVDAGDTSFCRVAETGIFKRLSGPGISGATFFGLVVRSEDACECGLTVDMETVAALAPGVVIISMTPSGWTTAAVTCETFT